MTCKSIGCSKAKPYDGNEHFTKGLKARQVIDNVVFDCKKHIDLSGLDHFFSHSIGFRYTTPYAFTLRSFAPQNEMPAPQNKI